MCALNKKTTIYSPTTKVVYTPLLKKGIYSLPKKQYILPILKTVQSPLLKSSIYSDTKVGIYYLPKVYIMFRPQKEYISCSISEQIVQACVWKMYYISTEQV